MNKMVGLASLGPPYEVRSNYLKCTCQSKSEKPSFAACLFWPWRSSPLEPAWRRSCGFGRNVRRRDRSLHWATWPKLAARMPGKRRCWPRSRFFPAPAASKERTVRVREIQDLLLLRGVNVAEHRFSGCSEVTIRLVINRPHVVAERPVSAAVAQRIKRRILDAMVKYLTEQSGTPQDWSVEFELTEAKARVFDDPVLPIQVAGGAAPWTGLQRFDVAIAGLHPAGVRSTLRCASSPRSS